MSYQYPGEDPNQPTQYSGYTPQQPQPTDPYSGDQYGQGQAGYQQGGYQQQQPSYGQPPYGQQYGQYGQPQYGMPGMTSMGISQNAASGLSYVFFWLSGLIIFLVEKQNREVRFHAMQSLLFFGGLGIISIVLGFIGGLPFLGLIAYILLRLLWLVAFIGWIVLMINGFQGRHFKLPIVGDYAERYASGSTF